MHKFFWHCVGSFFGAGYFRYAPGTFTSFLTLFLLFIFYYQPFWVYLLVFLVLLILAYQSYDFCLHQDTSDHDPKAFVIDEVLGLWVSCAPVVLFNGLAIFEKVWISILAFFLFRFFDIYKMGLVRYLDENYPNAHGVIGDDLIAGLQTALIILAFFWIII